MKKFVKLIAILLAVATVFIFGACNDQPEYTGENSTPEEGIEVPTYGETDPETDPEPDEDDGIDVIPGEPLPEGMMVYYEDFNSLGNEMSYGEIIEALGWRLLFKNKTGVPAELEAVSIWGMNADEDLCGANTNNSTLLSVKDGRLYFENYHGVADGSGNKTQPLGGNTTTDSYFKILESKYMEACGWGDYTVQYELEYDAWSEVGRYAVMLLNYSYRSDGEPTYCSAHLRVSSVLNHEVRFDGAFMGVSAGSIVSGSDKTDTMSLAVRVFGRDKFDSTVPVAGNQKITVTIKAVRRGSDWSYTDQETGAELGFGYHIFVNGKLASTFNPYGSNGALWDIEQLLPGDALVFKIGGKIDVYLDNVAVWTGCGDMPTDTSTEAYEEIVKAN